MEVRRKPEAWDVLLLLLALGGTGFSLTVSLGFSTMAVFTAWGGDPSEAFFPVWAAAAFGAVGLTGLPAAYWSIRGLVGRGPIERRRPRPIWLLGIALFPLSLLLGYLAFERQALPQGFGVLAHLLAAGAPVLAATSLGLQLGPEISIRRAWGHFLSGLWAVPLPALVLELLALVPFVLVAALGLSLTAEGRALLDLLSSSPLADEADLARLAGELASQPWLVVVLAAYLSLLVPLLEEALKTVTLWPVLGRRPSPAQAFLGGLLGGAGYALFESLFLPQPGGDWAATMLARGGTPLVHGLATGMACWGLAEAARSRRWARLVGAYLAAVSLHGSWNLGAVALGVSAILPMVDLPGLDPAAAPAISLASSAGLVGLSLLSLLGVILLLRRLTDHERLPSPAEPSPAAR